MLWPWLSQRERRVLPFDVAAGGHGGDGTVSGGGDYLAELFGAHIPRGKYAGDTGFRGLACQDIAVFVQSQLPLHQGRGRHPADADEKQVLQDLQLIFRAFAGDTPVLIYLQNGKIVRTSAQGGVHPTIEFFDTVADLVGRPNIKGRPVF